MAGEEERKKQTLVRVALGLLAGSIVLAVAPQLLDHYDHSQIDLGVWAFVALFLAGAIGTFVRSLGVGTVAGALFGFTFSVVGGIVDALLGGAQTGADWRSVISAATILSVFGLVLGFAGGLPVWAVRKWAGKQTQNP